MKTKLTPGEIRTFLRAVEIMHLSKDDRPKPANEVERVVQRAEDYILREFSAGTTHVDSLWNTVRNLAVLRTMGDEGAPQPLIDSVRRDTGQPVIRRVERSAPGGYIYARG